MEHERKRRNRRKRRNGMKKGVKGSRREGKREEDE